jgi:hypothetical protein
MDRAILHIHSRVYVVLSTIQEASACISLKPAFFLSGEFDIVDDEYDADPENQTYVNPWTLADMYKFSETLQRAMCHHAKENIVICVGSDPKFLTNISFLLGGYMILGQDFDFSHLMTVFGSISPLLVHFTDDLELHDCWRALIQARCLGWLNFSAGAMLGALPSSKDHTIDMLEYMHYDQDLNGKFHMIVPDKLLIFPCPQDLPAGQLWTDVDGERAFSAAYYADIFADFDVKLVIRVCPASYDASDFESRGIEVEDLHFEEEADPGMLRKIDRFLTLTRYAPGAVAVHGDADGLGLAGTLVAAHLINAHGFAAPAAIAWLRMASPDAADAPHRRALCALEARVRSLRQSMPLLPADDSADAPAPAPCGGGGGCGGRPVAPPVLALQRSASEPRLASESPPRAAGREALARAAA